MITKTVTRPAGQSHSHSFGSGRSTNNPSVISYRSPQASRSIDSGPQPVHGTVSYLCTIWMSIPYCEWSKRSNPQTHYQPPVSELSARGSTMVFNQSTASRGTESHQQQIYDAVSSMHAWNFYILIITFILKNYAKSSSTYGPPVSISHGNQSSQACGGFDSRSPTRFDTVSFTCAIKSLIS